LKQTREKNEILQNDLSRVENIESSMLTAFEMEGFVKKDDFASLQ